MNTHQLSYLEALEIPIWVRPENQPHPIEVQCLIDESDWHEGTKSLFYKIMAALNWSSYEVVHDAKHLTAAASLWVAFGNKGTDRAIQVSTLNQMLSSAEAKKHTWQILKPYAKH